MDSILIQPLPFLLILIGAIFLLYYLRKKWQGNLIELKGELNASKSYMDNVVTSMTDALFVITPDAKIESVNHATASLLGYSEDELTGKPFRLVCEAVDEDIFNTEIWPLVEKKLQVIHDRDSEDFWSLLKSAQLGALIVGAKGVIVMANEEIESIFGYGSGELTGKTIHDLLPPELRESHKVQQARFMEKPVSKRMGHDRILAAQRKDGSTLQLEVGLIPLQIHGESHVVSIVRDPANKEKWEFTKFTRFGQLFSEDAFSNIDRTLISKSQSRIPVLMSGSIMRDNANAIHGAVLVAKNIAQRKAAEKALQKSEERSLLLLNSSGEAIYGSDLDGICTFCNPACLNMLGYKSEDQLLGKNMHELLHFGSSCNESDCPISSKHNIGKGSYANGESLRRADGSAFAADFWSYPIIREKEIVGSVSRFIDITDRKKAQEAQIASEKRVRTIADSVPVLISYVDVDHRFRFNNKTYEEWFGIEPGAFIGMHLRDALSSETYEAILPRVEAALAGKAQSFESLIHQKGVGNRFVQVRYVPDLGNNGKVHGFYTAITDLTERKQAEENKVKFETQLRRSQKLKTIGTLAGGIAHDFNNILTPILGYTDLALLSVPPTDPLHQDLHRIRGGTHRAKDLVEQILLFSKQMEKERKAIHLSAIILEALKLLRPSIPATIQIEKRIDPDCPKVLADESQMHQVVVNLCTNAWQAMENQNGTLTIELTRAVIDETTARLHPLLAESEHIRLSITDTGIGMDQDHVERIFEPFFTTKGTDNKGTGLGLPVIHEIVNSHGGNILVDSIPGKGTSVHVYLPGVQSPSSTPPPTEQTIQGGEETILIVDDEEDITILLKRMLEQLGYVVDAFNDALEALEAVKAAPDKYDLVITDLTMPHLTGLELSKKLQAIHPTIPIIITSGFSHQLSEESLEDYNIKQILEKPVVMQELISAIRNVLDTA